MNTIWLHGLEDKAGGYKVAHLDSLGECFAPKMNYRIEREYRTPEFSKLFLLTIQKMSQSWYPDCIVASGIGGYYAYHLAKCIATKNFKPKTLLFNPALPLPENRKGLVYPAKEITYTPFETFHTVVCGADDDIINPNTTFSYLRQDKEKGCTNTSIVLVDGMGHLTHPEVFYEMVDRII